MALLVASSALLLGNITAAWTPTAPGVHQAGDLLIVWATGHGGTSGIDPGDGTTNPGTNPRGFTYIGGLNGGTGAGGTDTGPVYIRAYAKIATSSADLWPILTPMNRGIYQTYIFRPPPGFAFADAVTTAATWIRFVVDALPANPLTGTAAAWGGAPTAGDAILAAGGLPTDSGLSGTVGALSCAGLSGGTVVTTSLRAGTGQDGAFGTAIWEGFTGTATSGLTMTWPWGATAGSQNAGILAAIAVRVVPSTSPVKMLATGATLKVSSGGVWLPVRVLAT